jgi:tyrosyl-tRNA synthetase
MIERDMFQKRIKAGKPIGLHEFLYPLMQGYDSVAMDVDAELGGTDQTFNMLVGRDLLKAYKNKEKYILTTKLLIDPKTGKKIMNKSEGGLINLDDSPDDMFGKTMAISDDAMFTIAELCTELSDREIMELRAAITGKKNPRDIKREIARSVTAAVYGEQVAREAEKRFAMLFSKKEIPEDVPELKIKGGKIVALDLVVASDAAKSKGEARRLIEQGGLEVAGENVKDPQKELTLEGGEVIKVGKRRFFRVKV